MVSAQIFAAPISGYIDTPKYAMITGASRGIGQAISNELWNNGYSLILVARSISDLKTVKNELPPRPHQKIYIFGIDITGEEELDLLFKQLSKQNISINVLVNNAGTFTSGTTELTTSQLRHIINTNLIAAHNLVRHVLPSMKELHDGYIINIGSIAGNNAISGIGGYSASKYALRGLNDSLFKELSVYGIKVTCISPSVTETSMVNNLPGFSDGEKIQTLDIAKTVTFILSLGKSALIKDIEIYNTKMVAYAVHEQSLPIDSDY